MKRIEGEDVQAYLKSSTFPTTKEDKFRELAQLARVEEFSTNEMIQKEGDAITRFYWIHDGQVEVHRPNREPLRLGRGEFFGEAALVSKVTRSANVRATRKTQCLVFEGSELRSYPQLVRTILERADQRRGDPPAGSGEHERAPKAQEEDIEFSTVKSETLFREVTKSFIEDYMFEKLNLDHSGWRSLNEISRHTMLSHESLRSKDGSFGPLVGELLSRGLIETRVFKGERGRGGSVVKVRLAYDREPVKRYVDQTVRKRKMG